MFVSPVFRVLLGALAVVHTAAAGVWINEFMAAASDRRISWNTNGAPRLGSGVQWMEPQFVPTDWVSGALPAGYGFSGSATDLQSAMKDKAYALYLRKEFSVAPDPADNTNRLVLSVQFNDGFIAYLNGKEIARANCGPTNHFMFASQPAYNVNTSTGLLEYAVGTASQRLLPGVNVLAIQAHNADKPDQISSHIPTTEFRINAGLRVLSADTNVPDTILVRPGQTGGAWRMLVGRYEPSGGVLDPGLVNKPFTPPMGEDDDYEETADFSDWVELHNDSDTATNISNWTLSDDAREPFKWRFPANTFIPAKGYLLVLCDDKDEANAPAGPATRLHASFKLDSEGDSVVLYDSSGRFIDGFAGNYPPQEPFYSYGRNPERPLEMVYLGQATPGGTNTGPVFTGQALAPEFRDAAGKFLVGGLYPNQPLEVHLSSPTPEATIHYTLDGSEPGTMSPIYSAPITLIQPNERVGTVLRARAMLPNRLPSPVVTHTFLLRQPALLTRNPVILLSGTAGRTFYAPQGVLTVAGGAFSNSLWYALSHNSYNIALGSGVGYERECWVEGFFPSNYFPTPNQIFSAGAGLRISASPWQRPRMNLNVAATSSPWPQRDTTQKPSFNIYFSGDYGPGSLPFTIFTNSTVHEYRHLRLRAGKNDNYNPFITDEMARRLSIDMGLAGSRGLFCSLYVNGTYKGVYNLCERLREPFFQAHYQNDAEWDVCYSHAWVNGDSVAYQTLLTALDRDLTNSRNWQTVTNRIDIDNAADYYLLNIYGSTWDWPGNNFGMARARVSGLEGRFRFCIWDAEGAFQAVGSSAAKPVSYNTLTGDLLLPPSHPAYNGQLARIFRRLCTSPEFRLRFADRVNLHMFNQGVLDDRDPDGAGPLKSRFRERLDELVLEAGDLVRYNAGQSLNTAPFLSWISSTSGRRTFLLGSTSGRQMLRDSGLWPRTEPPVFSQHGGLVPPGAMLSITSYVAQAGQTSVVYYTRSQADPRRGAGLTLHSNAVAYTEPFLLEGAQTITARAYNPATGEWSPLTQASFAVSAIPADSNNLVVAEVMYHPPSETSAEVSAGFQNADDFEFLRLQNIGEVPVDLRGLRCADGVTFNFSAGKIQFLAAGSSALVVKNEAAFLARYGQNASTLIAGEYDGNLANGGERLLLTDTNGAVVREFSYEDRKPWPTAADGGGSSMLLACAGSNPDHARPENWVASAAPGGMPTGAPQPLTYDQWRFLFWGRYASTNALTIQAADPDKDGIPNYTEYAIGTDPQTPNERPRVAVSAELEEDERFLLLQIRWNPGAQQARLVWQSRDAISSWQDDATVELREASASADGTEVRTYVNRQPAEATGTRMFRAVVR